MTGATKVKALRDKIIGLIDLTSLNDNNTDESIIQLCQQAETPYGNVAALCIYPKFVSVAKSQLAPIDVMVATVVNFPDGQSDVATVLQATQAALAAGADEIDIVIPYHDIQQGNWQTTTDLIQTVKAMCTSKTLKVILETGALNANQIRQAAITAIAAGADFLKTSTGKITIGATLEAAEIMLNLIYQHYKATSQWVGFKASGGVRTFVQAEEYLNLACSICGESYLTSKTFRFGASSLLADVLKS